MTGETEPMSSTPPEFCPAGHPTLPGRYLAAWEPGAGPEQDAGHRTWICRAPVEGGGECGAVTHDPPTDFEAIRRQYEPPARQ